jgi:aspartate racemase
MPSGSTKNIGSNIDFKDLCIYKQLEAQVERTPDAIAVVCEDQQLTYRELNTRANQLAHYLQALEVKPDVLVGICLERSLEMVVGLLGILKAGGAYVALDPTYPKERLAYILKETQVPLLVTQRQLVEQLPQLDVPLVCLDTDEEAIARESEENPVSQVTSQHLAYVIFTSGSTGKPKGVQITQGNLGHYAQAMSEALTLQSDDIYLHTASFSFSSSVRQLMVPLSQGATVVIATAEQRKNPLALFDVIKQHNVTIIDIVPSYWQTCYYALGNMNAESRTAVLDNKLRLILSASAPLSSDIPKNWRFGFQPDVRFINMFGQTETTGIVAVYPIPDEYSDEVVVVPIGRPIANTQIYVLNENRSPVPVGEIGEMYVGGAGLGRGYLNRPDLTQERFIPNPFSDEPGACLYKTGDLGRYRADGIIEFVGRMDYQVKIRGMRVELGEIELAIAQHPGVRETVVIAKENVSGDKSLVAYIVPKLLSAETSQTALIKELRSLLQQKLPDYMVPSAFVMLEALPLTPNGKIDRTALPAPDQVRQDLEETFVAPQDELELELTRIWEKVLGVQPIGVRDNFFDLGGHSLLAVQLFAEIEKIVGTNLPLATLLQASTIEELARVLRQKEWSAPWSSLVAIQPGSSKPPLFCVHPIGGNVLEYLNLIPYLGSEQPVYGLQAQGLDGKQTPLNRVEDMATHYIKEIRTLQPEGPYFLAGFSFGGLVAFEMAQQLHGQGQKVALIALFDSHSPKLRENGSSFLQRACTHLTNLWQLEPMERFNYVRDLVRWYTNKGNYKEFMRNHLPESLLNFDVLDANSQATKDYVGQVYPGVVSLFRCSVQKPQFSHDPQLGWGSLVGGGLESHTVPGEHDGMFKEPRVRVLAEKLKLCLDKTQAEHGFDSVLSKGL